MHDFQAWPKTARLFRNITVTEKLDGTNAAIHISTVDNSAPTNPDGTLWVAVEGTVYAVNAQSRTRLIYPGKSTDNYGFAAWVYENAERLVRTLGTGLHFGEWWGKGIQRNYGLDERRFSLFNTERFAGLGTSVGGVWVASVPVMYQGTFSEQKITECLNSLAAYGSEAVPGFAPAEGICVFHHATRNVYKVTLDNNDAGKWEA